VERPKCQKFTDKLEGIPRMVEIAKELRKLDEEFEILMSQDGQALETFLEDYDDSRSS
jgi:hypothetical protein